MEQRSLAAIPAVTLPGASFAHAQRESRSGCDIVQVHRARENRLVFALIDVAGNRFSNAAIVEAATQIFQRTAVELFEAADLNESEALSQLAQNLNRSLMSRGARFAAAFLGCYEASTGALWYINAGHTPALTHDGTFHELGASGVPFGLFSHAIHDAQITVLQPRSACLLLSKGAVEMRMKKGKFGLEGAKQVMAKGFATANELCFATLEVMEASADRRSLERDDRTAVALVR